MHEVEERAALTLSDAWTDLTEAELRPAGYYQIQLQGRPHQQLVTLVILLVSSSVFSFVSHSLSIVVPLCIASPFALSYPAMFRKISSAVTSVAGSLTGSPARQLPPNHHDPARAESYVELAKELQASGVPVSFDDCAACDHPCPPTEGSEGAGAGTIVEAGTIWEGKTYEQYVMDKYGDLGELPAGFDTDWESELAGSAKFGKGRVVVISTGKSDWERDHTVRESESVGWRWLPSHVLHFFGLSSDLRSGRGRRVRPQAGEVHLKSCCQGGERRQGRQGQGRQR